MSLVVVLCIVFVQTEKRYLKLIDDLQREKPREPDAKEENVFAFQPM